jgi:hypothetical protein
VEIKAALSKKCIKQYAQNPVFEAHTQKIKWIKNKLQHLVLKYLSSSPTPAYKVAEGAEWECVWIKYHCKQTI